MSLPLEYLGDGAYVEFNGESFRLYTSNGIEQTNSIFLGKRELKNLQEFAERIYNDHLR